VTYFDSAFGSNDIGEAEQWMEAAYGRVDDADGLHEVTTVPMAHEHTDGSRHWFTATVPLERTGAFGYTVRVLPYSEYLANPAELGVVANA